jgi:hypothetical protein
MLKFIDDIVKYDSGLSLLNTGYNLKFVIFLLEQVYNFNTLLFDWRGITTEINDIL